MANFKKDFSSDGAANCRNQSRKRISRPSSGFRGPPGRFYEGRPLARPERAVEPGLPVQVKYRNLTAPYHGAAAVTP